MAPAGVDDGADEREDNVKGTVVTCFEHATYAVGSEETAKSLCTVEREGVDMEADSGELC